MKLTGTMLVLLLCATAGFAGDDEDDKKAVNHIKGNPQKYGLGAQDELKRRSIKMGANGENHIRYDRFHKGVKVFEGEAIAHVDRAGAVTVTDSLGGSIDLDVSPKVNGNSARASVAQSLGMNPNDVTFELQILPRGQRSPASKLVWHMTAFSENDDAEPRKYEVFVDAQTGAVVWMFDALEHSSVDGTGYTMYAGQVTLALDLSASIYYMRALDGSKVYIKTNDMKNRQNGSGTTFSNTTGAFGNSQRDLSDRSTAGADAHFGLVKTWKYYFDKHNRNGIDGNGRSTYARVHYGRNYENAFWSSSCFCMTFGDGANTFYPLVSLDVAGHELSHGVMAAEANLTYSGESGGLNEANSDIFGSLVEFYAASTVDIGDWWIGERIYKSNWSGNTYTQTKALRYMDDPAKDGRSPACWSPTIGSLNVHYSSGPMNHAFYLLVNGGASKCNGNSVTGIGQDEAAKIWYDAISNRMTSSTNYAGARVAALAAAAALFGNPSQQYASVAAAFSAINVN
ncbi:MAG: M4 family metallopeptidase [Acidobacteria bacterium]|nr:M4 family metallopeptidase [Acidobacteriota bacterium]